jgi:hypothetical protein
MRQLGSVVIEGERSKTGWGKSSNNDSLYWNVFNSSVRVLAWHKDSMVLFNKCSHLPIASDCGHLMTWSGTSTVVWHLGHNDEGALPCLHKVDKLGAHPCISLTVDARSKTFNVPKYLPKAKVLTKWIEWAVRLCLLQIKVRVSGYARDSGTTLDRLPMILWSVGWFVYRAHFSAGETEGSGMVGSPFDCAWLASLSHQTL